MTPESLESLCEQLRAVRRARTIWYGDFKDMTRDEAIASMRDVLPVGEEPFLGTTIDAAHHILAVLDGGGQFSIDGRFGQVLLCPEVGQPVNDPLYFMRKCGDDEWVWGLGFPRND